MYAVQRRMRPLGDKDKVGPLVIGSQQPARLAGYEGWYIEGSRVLGDGSVHGIRQYFAITESDGHITFTATGSPEKLDVWSEAIRKTAETVKLKKPR